MTQSNILDQTKIFYSSVVGFEMEFYSEMPRKEIAKELGRILRKNIVVGDVYHSDLVVAPDTFKLEPDFSGGSKMNELITSPMPYQESVAVATKILAWIRENGWTDEKCALHANISFDKMKIDLKWPIESVNRLKFILGFDEEMIYDKFPNRRQSIYARSINKIFPINKFVFSDADDYVQVSEENYELPNEKYYGINFSKLSKGYFEIRYMGGRNYEKKTLDIMNILNYIILFTYNTLQSNYAYTDKEIARLQRIMKDHKKVVTSFSDFESFQSNYPKINLSVDLKSAQEILKTFYPVLREQIFNLIVRCGFTGGYINYDADVSRYQIKNATMMSAFPLQGFEVINSKIRGNVLECHLYACDIRNSHIVDCVLHGDNEVKDSKVINTPAYQGNVLERCYIDNKKHLINCQVIGGIIRSGDIGQNAQISKTTEVIQAQGYGKEGGKGGVKDKDFGAKSLSGSKDGPDKSTAPDMKQMPKGTREFSWKL
jgi:hypothetical protein